MSATVIHHDEGLGLLPAAPRTEAGYRQYDAAAVHTPRFIRRAGDLGFGTHETCALLALWRNRKRASGQVKRIDAMQAMQRTLEHLAHCCAGNARPDCPILDDLAGRPA